MLPNHAPFVRKIQSECEVHLLHGNNIVGPRRPSPSGNGLYLKIEGTFGCHVNLLDHNNDILEITQMDTEIAGPRELASGEFSIPRHGVVAERFGANVFNAAKVLSTCWSGSRSLYVNAIFPSGDITYETRSA